MLRTFLEISELKFPERFLAFLLQLQAKNMTSVYSIVTGKKMDFTTEAER